MTLPTVTLPKPSTYKKFGAYMVCQDCGYTIEFCGCAKQAAPTPAADGAERDLIRRARECHGGR